MSFSIKPSIGVARLGNSTDQFCLSPDSIGGLPYEADANGNQLGPIKNFKDELGRVRRQGQPFKIYDASNNEITLDSPNVASMEWTVHLANKKAAWYNYSELNGNLLYGPENSYANQNVEFRNANVTNEADRQALIIDPGPRVLNKACMSAEFDAESKIGDYPVSFPSTSVTNGSPITTLGTILTDSKGRLVVLGGYGNAGGNEPLTSYGGSNTWHDDISDGPVYCTVTFNDGTPPANLQAWCIVGSPDFAPEIVNISNLSDSMFDVGVRSFDLVPEMCNGGVFNPSYMANYQRDILPIINRIGRYQWVSNVQSMAAFASNIFDFGDNSNSNLNNRKNYFSYFRPPNDKSVPQENQPQQQLMLENGEDVFPMMPLNSGSNSVSNDIVVKFLSLNETQYFLLGQWAAGLFENNSNYTSYPISSMDQAAVGNCVGLPMCPGIEVTWSVQNPKIYSSPFVISDQKGAGGYKTTGLTPSRDECEGGGCEPGDLTKRMACPWQADFFQCTIQYVNFTNSSVNKVDKKPLPPTYYSYWWPPQSPWDVLTGELTVDGQKLNHLPAGQQMNYARGINSFVQMVEHWSALAFIRDSNSGSVGFPYFSESERNNELFDFKDVPVGDISGNTDDNETLIPVFFIDTDSSNMKAKGKKANLMLNYLEERAFKPISVHKDGLPLPRSGTRRR